MVRLASIFGGASAYDGHAKKKSPRKLSLHSDSEGTDFIFPFYAGDRMIFAKIPRKKFSPLGEKIQSVSL
jgi:hypothetical protein